MKLAAMSRGQRSSVALRAAIRRSSKAATFKVFFEEGSSPAASRDKLGC